MATRKYHEDRADSRTEFERSENLPERNVDAPAERFQDTQQVNPAITAGDNKTPASPYTKKSSKNSGSKLKQEVAAEVITGKAAGGPSSDVFAANQYGLKAMSFGGDAGTIMGDVSGTPTLGKDAQGKTRFDKRNSDANKQINFIASEQIAVEYENIPPLSKSDDVVGYNGNPKLTNARSQKASGKSPAELLYDRSLDEIRRDEFVFTHGQVVKQAGVQYSDYPTKSVYQDEDGVYHDDGDFTLERGNYSPRSIEITVANDGKGAYVKSFEVLTDDFSANSMDYDVVNRSAVNQITDMNNAELARQRIDAAEGAPTAEHFNPLGRSVVQPTATVMYLRDMEAATGAIVAAAYRFAQKARGYYLNRTAKDGQDLTGPAIDALYGHLMGAVSLDQLKASFDAADNAPFIDKRGLRKGSAAMLLSVFDSVSKYKTKADLVNQPRGLKMHLQTADNNMNPLRVKPEFIKALNAADVFSTINRGYDPMGPVCVTDNVRLVLPYDWNKMLKYTRSGFGAARTYQSTVFTYRYAAGSGQNWYYIKCGEPVLNGIAWFFEQHVQAVYNAVADGSRTGEVKLSIPCVSSGCHFSLWDLLICASTPYIIYERTNTMKDILDFETTDGYPFPEFKKLEEVNLMAPTNYSMPGADAPIAVQQMLPSSAIRWTWAEAFTTVGQAVIMPWYTSETSFDISTDAKGNTTIRDNGSREFLTPVLRSGTRVDIVDDALGMAPKDLLMVMDPITVMPFGLNSEAGGVYKYSKSAEGIPYITTTAWTDLGLKREEVHHLPRLLGWNMPAYAGECCVYSNAAPTTDRSKDPYGSLAEGTSAFAATDSCAVRARQYWAYSAVKATKILENASMAINRAQAFTQKWAEHRATGTYSGNSKDASFDLGLSLSEYVSGTAAAATFTDEETAFTPFTGTGSGAASKALIALHKYFWTRISKLPFVINPFDVAYAADVEPFDFAYMFNMAGFMAADYNELEYDRRNEVQQQGFCFTVDPYQKLSPILR